MGIHCNLCLFTVWTIFSSKSVSFSLPPSHFPTSRDSRWSGYLIIWAFTKMSAKRKYAVYILLCLASFAQHKVCKDIQCFSKYQFPIPFHGCVIFNGTYGWFGKSVLSLRIQAPFCQHHYVRVIISHEHKLDLSWHLKHVKEISLKHFDVFKLNPNK